MQETLPKRGTDLITDEIESERLRILKKRKTTEERQLLKKRKTTVGSIEILSAPSHSNIFNNPSAVSNEYS